MKKVKKLLQYKFLAITAAIAVAVIGGGTALVLARGSNDTKSTVATDASSNNSGTSSDNGTICVTACASSSDTQQQPDTQEQQLEQQEKAAQDAYNKAQQNYQDALNNANSVGQQAQAYTPPTYTPPAVSTPTSFPLLIAEMSGPLTGTYHYAVSFVSTSGTETDLGPESLAVFTNNQEVYVSGIPSGSSTVQSVKLYRTKANASLVGPYYLVATLSNYTSFYYDSMADSSLPTWTMKYQ